MDFAPWRLTDDQNSSGARKLQNGSGTERQIGRTDLTRPNFAQYTCQRHSESSLQGSAIVRSWIFTGISLLFHSFSFWGAVPMYLEQTHQERVSQPFDQTVSSHSLE
jgi:hypothetical protein